MVIKKVFFILVIFAISTELSFGQAALEAGSRGAHRAMVRHKQAALEREIHERELKEQLLADERQRRKKWQQATKLTVLKEIRESPHSQVECLNPAKLKDKSVGYLDYWQTEVTQVVGPKDMLLTLECLNSPLDAPDAPIIWLSDYPTKGLVDSQRVQLIGPIEVQGTKSYETTLGGQSTVRAIHFVALEKALKYEAEERKVKLAAMAIAEALLYREFTDKTGNHKISAKFLLYEKGKARLERKDGTTLDIPLGKLSKEDQRWIQSEVRKSRK